MIWQKEMIKLYLEPKQSAIVGQNGCHAALGSYAWRHDEKRLVQMYQELEQVRSSGSAI